jgi:protein TonB
MKFKFLLFAFFLTIQFMGQNSSSSIQLIEYKDVDLKPDFPGGLKEFFKFVGKNYVTPDVEGLSGIMKVSFIIEPDGSLSNIKTLNDLGSGSAEEAIRVMGLSPKWFPGEQNGKKVRVIYQFPIKIESQL